MDKDTIKQKIGVGFLGYSSKKWMGGVNYLKNVLYAIQSNPNNQIHPYVFIYQDCDPDVISIYKQHAEVIFINNFEPVWFLLRIFDRTFKRELALNYLFKKHHISILSHNVILHPDFKIKSIAWFPDFQHLHLPEFIGKEEVALRNRVFIERIEKADKIILSSEDAYKDMVRFSPDNLHKAEVLNFVSQIDEEIYGINQAEAEQVFKKYGVGEKYFFLPNQFWNHKNHIIVFKAIGLLKKKGIQVQLICTGNLPEDDKLYVSLNGFIKENSLQEEIKQLGLINYRDLQCLMRYAVSVINPSLFEGWSSSVEECKSMGKNMILSDIDVHKEQAPAESFYFDPHNEAALADILSQKWEMSNGGPDFELEVLAKKTLKGRTIQMALTYEKIVQKALTD